LALAAWLLLVLWLLPLLPAELRLAERPSLQVRGRLCSLALAAWLPSVEPLLVELLSGEPSLLSVVRVSPWV
jgi:hypothetical protein